VSRRCRPGAGLVSAGLVALACALPMAACTEVETESAAGYEPSKLEALGGDDDRARVTFTAEGARRTGLRTAVVRRSGGRLSIPYAALLYDPEGGTHVYTAPEPLQFLRAAVAVDRIEGDRVLLTKGPAPGTRVVTAGAAEVYGAELEVPSH
jgi:hypothetical protein